MSSVLCNTRRGSLQFGLVCLALLLLSLTATRGQLIDSWRAGDLNLFDEGDAVGSWTSTANRTALSIAGAQPRLRKDATPGGSSVLRFDRNWMTVSSSPVAGLKSFSIALVFKAAAVGTNSNSAWNGKSGIIDAEESGVASDWGLVVDERGRLAFGSGQPDATTTIPGSSLVDSNFHVAVVSWGAGAQAVYLDDRPVARRASGTSLLARNSAGFSFGAIHTSDGALGRRFVGDLAEVRFYGASLNPAEATNVIQELKVAHLQPNLPVIRRFTASTNSIYVGESVTLSWQVTNQTGLSLAPDFGTLAEAEGSVRVFPKATTTYVLAGTNDFGSRRVTLTVFVDPGIPLAHPQSVVTIRNTSRDFVLAGSDPNGGVLTFAVRTAPTHGTLSGLPPTLRYEPAADYAGSDSFTFVTSDGDHESASATVAIRVDPLPTAPSRVVLSTTNLVYPTAAGSFVAALRTVDANPLDTHDYTLVPGNGSQDNGLFMLSENRLYLTTALSGNSPADLQIRLRTTDAAGLSLEQAVVFHLEADRSRVVLNEVHYNGANNAVREEFVELYNPKEVLIDLSGWRLQGGIDFVFPAATILPARSFAVVAQDPPTLQRVYAVQALGPWEGSLNNEGESLTLRDGRGVVVDKVDFRSEFPWPIAANGGGGSMELVNPRLDNNLGSSWKASLSPAIPSPGQTNRSFALNPPPNQRQVEHSPRSPRSMDAVRITSKVTDPEGVASVVLEYQVVVPGSFVPAFLAPSIAQLNANPFRTPAANPAYQANWVSVPMMDTGLLGDEEPGDDTYTAVLPAQAHRSLVRYRITATDNFGVSRRAPFEDDESLNFACFVYDEIPDYFVTSSATLSNLPVYHLITRPKDLLDCNGYDGLPQIDQFSGSVANEARYVFNWPGALVYNGEVYDHIRYRLRGANGRYQNGKRNMRFKFNDGRLFEARDQAGEKYPTKWASLTTGKGSSNRETLTYALNEVVNYKLWNLVGVPAPSTHYFHFRVIQGAQEAPDAYRGDFWGLSWAQENYDVRFLEAHGLPKGNLYKLINAARSEDILVDQQRQERYQAPFAVTNSADAFNIQQNLNATQTSSWLLAHVNYSNWYRFHAIAECIRHYDYWPTANKNAAWYFEPIYTSTNKFLGRLWTLPWDTDSTWGPTWNSGIDAPYNGIYAVEGSGTRKPELIVEYLNNVREIRDLLFQPDQILPLIDSLASQIQDFVPADLRRWSNAPTASNPKAISQAAYTSLSGPAGPGLTSGLAGYVADMKRFGFVGGTWPGGDVSSGGQAAYLDTLGVDNAIPSRPAVRFIGGAGHPLDQLVFQSSPFEDPQGANTFAAMRWRVSEVRGTNEPVVPPQDLPLEWNAVWESGELTVFRQELRIPGAYLKPGHSYRVRVSHKDNTGRWSRWSPASQFVPSPVDILRGIPESLMISELMYRPLAPGEANEDAYEFVEFKNRGADAVDLSGIQLSGITYTFTNGTVLDAGKHWLLVRDPVAFARRYPAVVFNGVYQGKLDNGGETLEWIHPQGVVLGSLSYGDRAPWPVSADGFGFSLVFDGSSPSGFRASSQPGGSPGQDDPESSLPNVVVNEVLASSSNAGGDAIELYNASEVPADVSGWWLTDDPSLPRKFRIPPGSLMAVGGYLRWNEPQFNAQPGSETSFALSSLGESIYLFSADAAGQLTGYSHGWDFGGSPDGLSIGRYVNSGGEESFAPQSRNSLGTANTGPLLGAVVISEIHYHPQASQDEFLELYNRTDESVSLFDAISPTNRWKIAGLEYTFPAGLTLGAHQHFLLVKDDPQQFRLRHSVAASTTILGPYAGSLQNNGELIELQAPATPTASGTPFFAVDQVRYRSEYPWSDSPGSSSADGAGASLQRAALAHYGNEPRAWISALPTPGADWVVGNPPAIIAHPRSTLVVAGEEARFEVTTGSPPPVRYQWRFQGRRLLDATNASFILPNAQLINDGEYAVDVVSAFGAVKSLPARLAVLMPLQIVNPPQSVFARPGTNVSFTVMADSTTALHYQWQRNGIEIPGATADTLELINVDLPHAGDYRVRVTDSVGSVLSSSASLVLLIDPIIVQEPLNVQAPSGGAVTFSVQVTNTATLPITYRWKRGSGDIAGALVTSSERTAFLTVSNVLGAQTNFSVTISNAARKTAIISRTASVTLQTDTDKDGLPDVWETQWGLNPALAGDAVLDRDGDRMKNLEEFMAGTDPADSASVLSLQWVGASELGGTLEFTAVAGRTYTLEVTADLAASVWTRLADYPAKVDTRLERITNPLVGGGRFYRVQTPRRR